MRTFEVTVPVIGTETYIVEARNEEDAMNSWHDFEIVSLDLAVNGPIELEDVTEDYQ